MHGMIMGLEAFSADHVNEGYSSTGHITAVSLRVWKLFAACLPNKNEIELPRVKLVYGYVKRRGVRGGGMRLNDPNTSSGANHPAFREALRAGARPIPSSRSRLFRAFEARWTLFATSRATAAMTAPTVMHRRPLSHPAMPRRRRVLGQVRRLRQRSTRRRARHQRLREQLKAQMAVTQRIRRCRARCPGVVRRRGRPQRRER